MRLATTISTLLMFMAPSAVVGQAGPVPALKSSNLSHAEAAKAALMTDPARALHEARLAEAEAAKLSQRSDRALADAQAKWLQSAALGGLHRSAEGLVLARKALHDDGEPLLSNQKLLGNLHLSVAYALVELGQIEEALKELRAAYGAFENSGDRRSQSLVLQSIGTNYMLARDYAHAMSYFRKSAEIYSGDPVTAMAVFYNIGYAYLDQGKYRLAIEQFEKSRAAAKQLKIPNVEARALGSLATAQLALGDDAGATTSIREGLAIVTRGAVGDWSVNVYRAAAQKALNDGNLGSAERRIEQAFGAVKGGMSTLLLRDVQRTAFEIYKAKREPSKALQHFEEFKRLDDQARATAASTNAALLAAQFDFANQRASIAQLRTREVQSEAKIARSQRTILLILLAGTGIVTTLLLFGFISIRRSRDRVRAANEELSETNAELENALQARTQFLATTSHEIRTPLNGILGMTQVVLADRALEPTIKSKIELVQGAGETMRALVDDILDVAKMTTGQLLLHPEDMDLHRLLRATAQVWESQAQTKGITLVLDLDDAPQRIVQDEVRLRQIVFNLMANAVKFTSRGEVRMTASAVPATAGEGERLRVLVKDTGIGIPAEKLEEIFESFRQVDSGTTRQFGGTGLGLAICRNLALAMGGDITVASVLGAGATFTLDIPLQRGAAPAALATVKEGTLASANLLLVEGNPLSQSIMRAVLSAKVASVTVASSAEEARTADGEGIDLILIDANTIGKDISTAAGLARPVLQRGGRAVLTWPSPDEATIAAAAEAGLGTLLATPIAAPDLVSALAALYGPERAPEEIAA